MLQIPDQQILKDQIDQENPAKAIAYLRTVPITEPILNDFSWGGYLSWSLPDMPVFIDSRADAFEQWGVFADYMHVVKLIRPTQILDKYAIQRVLLPETEPLVVLLKQTPGWAVEYEDGTAVIMRRSSLQHPTIIQRATNAF